LPGATIVTRVSIEVPFSVVGSPVRRMGPIRFGSSRMTGTATSRNLVLVPAAVVVEVITTSALPWALSVVAIASGTTSTASFAARRVRTSMSVAINWAAPTTSSAVAGPATSTTGGRSTGRSEGELASAGVPPVPAVPPAPPWMLASPGVAAAPAAPLVPPARVPPVPPRPPAPPRPAVAPVPGAASWKYLSVTNSS
jgi:hypothetical protein